MASGGYQAPVEEKLVCPYESSHTLSPSRMQVHLLKCRPAHPRTKLVICPYNSIHHIKNLDAHLKECESYLEMNEDNFGYGMDNSGFAAACGSSDDNVGPVQASFAGLTVGDDDGQEYWDDESDNCVSYNPLKAVLYKYVVRNVPPGLGKATRKIWRDVEAERLKRLQAGEPIEDLAFPTSSGDYVTIDEIVNESEARFIGQKKKSSPSGKSEGSFQSPPHKPNSWAKREPPMQGPLLPGNSVATNLFGAKLGNTDARKSGAQLPVPEKRVNKEGRKNLPKMEAALEIQEKCEATDPASQTRRERRRLRRKEERKMNESTAGGMLGGGESTSPKAEEHPPVGQSVKPKKKKAPRSSAV